MAYGFIQPYRPADDIDPLRTMTDETREELYVWEQLHKEVCRLKKRCKYAKTNKIIGWMHDQQVSPLFQSHVVDLLVDPVTLHFPTRRTADISLPDSQRHA